MTDETTIPQASQGVFYDKLTRNNSQIKKDRAAEIFEDAEIRFKRKIEDLC